MNNKETYLKLLRNAIKHHNKKTFDWIINSEFIDNLNFDKNYFAELAYKEGHFDMLMILFKDKNVCKTLENDKKYVFDYIKKTELTKRIDKF